MWEYQARLDDTRTGVVDGDTIDLRVDLGFYTDRRIRVRLQGVDTAEIFGVGKDSEEYAAGTEHKQFVTEWLATARTQHDGAWPLVVVTETRTGKYGRWVGTIERKADGAVLNEDLIVEYPSVED